MKKRFVSFLLLLLLTIPSCTFTHVKNITSGRCVVNYLLEDYTGEYVKNETYSYVSQYKVGEFVRVRPLDIDGYTCISTDNELCGTVPDIYYLGIDVKYRKNYRCEIQNRTYSSFLPNSQFSCYGDTIYIYRTFEALPKIVVLDKNNCSFTTPDMTKSGTIPMAINWENKEYNLDYDYTIKTANEIISETREILKTKKYLINPNSENNNDYSFAVKEEDYDFYTDPIIRNLFESFKNNLFNHSSDNDLMEKDRRDFSRAIVKQYGSFAQKQIQDILLSGLNILNHGVLFEDASYFSLGDPGGYNAKIKKDITIINGDDRFWIPEAYKPSYIYRYATHLVTDFNDPTLIRDLYYGLINDAVKAIGNVIIERECYYAIYKNNKLNLNGVANLSPFTFVWAYNSAIYPVFQYVGHTTYDANECKEYRLQSPFFNLNDEDGYKGQNFITSNECINDFIRNKVDEMFKG